MKNTKRRLKIVLISSLIIAALTSANRFISLNYKEWYEVLGVFIINFSFSFASWYIIILSDSLLTKSKLFKSSVIKILSTSIITLLIVFILSVIIYSLSKENSFFVMGRKPLNHRFIPVSIYRIAILITAIQTVKYMFEVLGEKQRVTIENEILKREKLNAQYQSLKQQVNPHFLFNSLNTLKSLIKTNDNQAEEFVIRLSEVYRYILQKNQDDLVTLGEELTNLKAYLFMLNARFENSISVSIQIKNELHNKLLLPPFTLQLLIENSIKHNIASHSKPLNIEIIKENNTGLIVRNNLQPKMNVSESTGYGLDNINKRCQFLSGKNIGIYRTEKEFIVELPLIWKNENSDH